MKATIKLLLVAITIAGLYLSTASMTADAAASKITVMTWGGHWLEIFQPIAKEFTKKTGIDVQFVVQPGSAAGLNKLAAQRRNPQVDVWTSIESTVDTATKLGLLSKLGPKQIPNLKQIPDDIKSETGVAIWLTPRGIFYRKDLVPFEITSWEDIWDPRLKDKVGVTFKLDTGNFLILAALLNGGDERHIDKGFEKVKQLKPNIHAIYDTDPESIRLVQSGEIAVAAWGILPNVYPFLGPDSKYRFVMPPPRFLATIPVSIVAGRGEKQEKAAEKFVNYLLRPDSQTIMASIAGTIPANPNAKAPDKLKKIIPKLPLTDVYHVDWPYVNKHYQQWQERWNREIK